MADAFETPPNTPNPFATPVGENVVFGKRGFWSRAWHGEEKLWQIMRDYAIKNGADPVAYIAQNQTYLQQCAAQMNPRQQAAPAAATPITGTTGPTSSQAPQIHER